MSWSGPGLQGNSRIGCCAVHELEALAVVRQPFDLSDEPFALLESLRDRLMVLSVGGEGQHSALERAQKCLPLAAGARDVGLLDDSLDELRAPLDAIGYVGHRLPLLFHGENPPLDGPQSVEVLYIAHDLLALKPRG